MVPHQYCTMKKRATRVSAAKPTPGTVNNCFKSGEKNEGRLTARKMADPHQTAALRIPTNLKNPITPPRYGNPTAGAKPYLGKGGGGANRASQKPGGMGGMSVGGGGMGGRFSTSVRHRSRS